MDQVSGLAMIATRARVPAKAPVAGTVCAEHSATGSSSGPTDCDPNAHLDATCREHATAILRLLDRTTWVKPASSLLDTATTRRSPIREVAASLTAAAESCPRGL